MEYEVTATRKRPGTLAEMVGQDFVVATLGNALSTGNLASAYLFFGPRGTGKTSTARILAKSLNCESGPTSSPCGTCSSCVEITRGASPDVIEIDGASNTSVNDVREIKDEVLYAPQSSPKKVYIVDEVHMLSNSAFNALLKTIEEPPPYIMFIFATTEIHKVPATIRSRCQQFRFRLFPPELIRDKLVEIADETGRDFDNDALYWIAREAGGSMRDAYTLFDQVLSFSREKITLDEIREKMGLVGLENTTELLTAASEGNRKKALDLLDEILNSGTAVEQVLLELAEFLRNLTLLAYGIVKESLLGLSPERFPDGPRNTWNTARLEVATGDAFTLYRDIRYSLNPRYELELFVGRLCSLNERLDASEILEKISRLRNELFGHDKMDTGSNATGNIPGSDDKKKILEAGATPIYPESTASSGKEAERFFSQFKNNRTTRPQPSVKEEREQQSAAVPENLPGKEHTEHAPEARTAEIPPEEKKNRLLTEVRRINMSLAAALEKALRWKWTDHHLLLVFNSSYEAVVVKNEGESLRVAGISAGLKPFAVETQTEAPVSEKEQNPESPRVALICQIFRGQIVQG